MKTLYFVSFEIRSVNLKLTDMCQIVMDKPVRSFGDVLTMAGIIKENYEKNIGECSVTIINYKRLEEETIYEKPNNEQQGVEQ